MEKSIVIIRPTLGHALYCWDWWQFSRTTQWTINKSQCDTEVCWKTIKKLLVIFGLFTRIGCSGNVFLPGSLAIIIFFVPVSFTVLVDVLFFATTLKTLNRMHTYGRIHHKLKHR